MAELVQLRDLQQRFEAAGVRLVAASGDTVEEVREAVSRHKLPFPVIADDGALMDALGLRDEGAAPGDRDTFFASSFLLDRDGIVRWCFLPDNVRFRADPEEVLAAAARIGGD